MEVNPSFWRGKRVLVTGHTGFKGGWLCLWLQSMGAEVTGYSLAAPTNPNLFEAANVTKDMTNITGDVLDLGHLQSVMSRHRPEIVFHMAAQALVRRSYAAPVETYATNVMGTVNVLETVRQTKGAKVVINVTSDKCYENREWARGYMESDPMGGHDPYSSSKGCAELVTAAYRNSFFNLGRYADHGVAVASARAGNVIGGGDWAEDRLIPDVVRAFMGGKPAVIRNPDAIRPWQHVLEPLSGYLVLAERLWGEGSSYAEAWNFGPDEHDTKPVRWVADKLAAMWGDGAGWKVDEKRHPHEAHYLKLDSSKARGRLGWRRILNLDQALRLTVDWYQMHAQGGDLQAITRRQIIDYTKLINGSSA
jgi:CDP-glucose 4,6-dehydratase